MSDSDRTFLSYYTYGAGIALALDLSLRDMSGGRISLDDYMKLYGSSMESRVARFPASLRSLTH